MDVTTVAFPTRNRPYIMGGYMQLAALAIMGEWNGLWLRCLYCVDRLGQSPTHPFDKLQFGLGGTFVQYGL